MMASSTLTLLAPAKVNLFLHITGKRLDGYHNLQTVFRLLTWGDTLTFSISEKHFNPHLPIDHSNLPISLNSSVTVTDNLLDNLVTKAAIALVHALKSGDVNTSKSEATCLGSNSLNLNKRLDNLATNTLELPNRMPVIEIQLDKQLPTGAGLGGGSSNAATTLLALNKLWNCQLDTTTLIKIASKVGADVPIFIFGQDAIAEGIGEILTPIDLPIQHYLMLNPNAHASTQSLFNHPDLKRDIAQLSHTEIRQQTDKYLNALSAPYHNVFQRLVIDMVPEVAEAMDYLQSIQSITSSTPRMTGTGSSVYLPIPMHQLNQIEKHIRHHLPPCPAIIAKTT